MWKRVNDSRVAREVTVNRGALFEQHPVGETPTHSGLFSVQTDLMYKQTDKMRFIICSSECSQTHTWPASSLWATEA